MACAYSIGSQPSRYVRLEFIYGRLCTSTVEDGSQFCQLHSKMNDSNCTTLKYGNHFNSTYNPELVLIHSFQRRQPAGEESIVVQREQGY
eukprot:TRINITY_DN7752_c0_g1_i1.p1 TRINITY_DN7752_c0_g1~~TRINITY_DN7752_c0_g1_i1.p1  ORF type:complete len:102 (+),score=3.71 TRINITY_DN7752_c0_g1_i1:38-307(+)